jgi:hypothetical protein
MLEHERTFSGELQARHIRNVATSSCIYRRSAGRGRNLQTGESLKIPATRPVRFKIGKRLRDAAAGSQRKRVGKGKK